MGLSLPGIIDRKFIYIFVSGDLYSYSAHNFVIIFKENEYVKLATYSCYGINCGQISDRNNYLNTLYMLFIVVSTQKRGHFTSDVSVNQRD